jgi:hypothetical protein
MDGFMAVVAKAKKGVPINEIVPKTLIYNSILTFADLPFCNDAGCLNEGELISECSTANTEPLQGDTYPGPLLVDEMALLAHSRALRSI